MLTLIEFLNDNTHRCYPFEDVNSLPTDFLVDAHFVTTDNVNKDGLYITKVTISNGHAQLYVAHSNGNDNLTDLGVLATIAITDTYNTEHRVKLINEVQEVIIEGSITVGSFSSLLEKSTFVYNLGQSGKIFSACVIPLTEWCTGLIINGKLYTGTVSIVTGEGITFKNSNDTIILEATGLQLPDGNIEVVTDKEMQSIAQAALGEGVSSINGCTGAVTIADGSYNIQRSYTNINNIVQTDANNISVITQGNAIVISNSKDDPMFNINSPDNPEENTSITLLLENAKALNERYDSIDKHNYSLDNAVNALSTQLAKVN